MKKGIAITGGIIIIAGALGVAGWYYFKGRGNGAADGEVVYVTAVSTLTGDAAGNTNRFAGVVEPQETVEVKIENGRKVRDVEVKTGDEVKKGQLLFVYDLSSIQDDLKEAKLALDRLKNEALSLADQISTLEKEKKKANSDTKLSYTIEIETNKMNLKKNEYEQISKQAEIDKLNNATQNTEVRSEIDGVIQKIDTAKLSTDEGDSLSEGSDYYYYMNGQDGGNDAFITILSTGAYRIKGKVNELNASAIIPGEPVIIRSRVDENEIWHGVMGMIDRDNAIQDNNDRYGYGMMEAGGDSQTVSSSYPFYVDLESSEGLMLGQHVYIEKDQGQGEKKDGLWLSEFFIVDADDENPYVWAASEDGKLEKREVILGNHNAEMGEYEIVDGLTKKDAIAFPEEGLAEGRPTAESMGMDNMAEMSGEMSGGAEMGLGEDMPEMIEEPYEELPEDFVDEEMVPMDEAPDAGMSSDMGALG